MIKKKCTASKPKRSTKPRGDKPAKRWSQEVTEHSDALDLERNVFSLNDPKKIAASLK